MIAPVVSFESALAGALPRPMLILLLAAFGLLVVPASAILACTFERPGVQSARRGECLLDFSVSRSCPSVSPCGQHTSPITLRLDG